MEAILKLNIDELDEDLLRKLKSMFPNRQVEIRVETEMDETEFILRNPKFAAELIERIKSVENGTKTIEVKLEELL